MSLLILLLVAMIPKTSKNPYKLGRKSHQHIINLFLFLLISSSIVYYIQHQTPNNIHKTKYAKLNKPLDLSAVVGTKNGECHASPDLLKAGDKGRPKEEWQKPIWFVTLHNSFPDNAHRLLIRNLTLLFNGGKSFYTSMKGKLRHCIGDTETATCAISDLPTKNFQNYSRKYMMYIRNPLTALPYSANMKDVKYHSLEGQMTVDKWRKTRDEWLTKMMEEWIGSIETWRKSPDFDIGLYIVHEDLMDPHKGPDVLREMAKIFREAGFDTIEDGKIPCAWLMSLGADNIQQHHMRGYEYNDYIPGYTKKQKKFIIDKVTAYMAEVGDSDKPLASILKRYIDDIRVNTVLDKSQ